MTAPSRRTLLRVVQVALAAIVVALVARKLVAEWGAVKLALAEARPNWLALAASGLVVLATYAVLDRDVARAFCADGSTTSRSSMRLASGRSRISASTCRGRSGRSLRSR